MNSNVVELTIFSFNPAEAKRSTQEWLALDAQDSFFVTVTQPLDARRFAAPLRPQALDRRDFVA